MKMDVKGLAKKMAMKKEMPMGKKVRKEKYSDDGSFSRFMKGIYEDTFPDRENTFTLVDTKGLAKDMARQKKKKKSENYY